jgi:phosphatidylethanolamine/phosphatidyl-N-methylethanolamine N-methyltransferase
MQDRKKYSKRLLEHALFLKNFIKSPMKVGSLVPSSKKTAQKIGQAIKLDDGYLLELGPGTGIFTEEIIKAGIPEEKIIALEIDPHFASMLRTKFPKMQVICGDATKSIPNQFKISTIVSGIPLLTLSKEKRIALMENIVKMMDKKSSFIQISYSPISPVPWKLFNLKQHKIALIWQNFPPVNIFEYKL